MKNIVHIEHNEATVSIADISKFSGISTRAIRKAITSNNDKFNKFGLSLPKEVSLDRHILNEASATFLMTLLSNTDEVVEFKFNLVMQFYKMREFVCESSKAQLEASRKQTIEAHGSAYAKPRVGSFQTVDRLRQDYNINLPTEELNKILKDSQVLINKPIFVNNYLPNPDDLRAIRQGNTTLVHEESAIEIFDSADGEYGLHRDNGAVDFNPTLPFMD